MKHTMKQIMAVLFTIILLTGSGIPCTTNAETSLPTSDSPGINHSPQQEEDYTEGEVIVQFNEEYSSKKEIQEELQTTVSDAKVETRISSEEESSALVSSDTCDTQELIEEFNSLDSVACVEPNYRFYATSLTNDTYANYQWYLEDNNTSGSDVSYSSVSALTPSSTPVVVVADTGVDGTQEDLKDSMYSFQMYNAMTGTYETAQDTDGHGTHIAGIIAATVNNNTGITGVSQAKLLAVKCMDENGGSLLSLIRTYNYVIAQKNAGVNICAINLSLGGNTSESSTLNNLITQAGELGILTVCSAGNDNTNIDIQKSYPASFDNDYIISVAASNSSNQSAFFTNYGQTSVDVFAPGTDIYSTYSQEDYNAENSHSVFYEDFEDYTINNVVTDSTTTSVSIAEAVNFISSPDASPEGKSLCWNVKSQPGQDYSIAIPYTVSAKQSNDTYLGVRIKIQENGPATTSTLGELNVYDTNKSNLEECNPSNITNAVSSRFETTTDYWNNYNMVVADSLHPKKAGTYYTIIEFYSDTTSDYNIYIDNLGIGTETSKYTYATGSSMSCPIVTGEVALLASLNPSMPAKEIRARVIGGVDTNNSYKQKCTSGGKVNFKKALNSPNPSISSINYASNKLTIQGYFLGTTPGSITLTQGGQSVQASVTSWSDTTVVLSTTALATGIYTITLTRCDGVTCVSGTPFSYVSPTYVSQVKLNKSSATLSPGKSLQLFCTLSPANISSNAVRWTTSNAKYAKVSSTGKVTAKKAGNKHSVTITCTATDRGTVSASCKIKIRQKVTKVSLNKTKLTMKARKSVKLKATIKPTNAFNKNVKWTSSNKKYATVNKKGKVTAKKAGKGHTVTITCKAADGSGKKAKCKIQIK